MSGDSKTHSHGCNAGIYNSDGQNYNSPRHNLEMCACHACVMNLRATSMSCMCDKPAEKRACLACVVCMGAQITLDLGPWTLDLIVFSSSPWTLDLRH